MNLEMKCLEMFTVHAHIRLATFGLTFDLAYWFNQQFGLFNRVPVKKNIFQNAILQTKEIIFHHVICNSLMIPN